MREFAAVVVVVVAAVFAAVCLVQASQLDEAKSLAEKAAVYVKANGKDKGIYCIHRITHLQHIFSTILTKTSPF